MRYFPFKHLGAGIALAGFLCVVALAQTATFEGVGKTPTQDELRAGQRGAGPSGKDLPAGRGTAKDGEKIFVVKCSMCHGADGQGVNAPTGSFSHLRGPRLGGGTSTPLWPSPNTPPGGPPRITTLSYYVALPTSIWNAISVGMPMFKPGSLTADEAYALTAFVLAKNGIIKEDTVMDRETLPKVEMPNRNNFIPAKIEDIPDIQKRACFKTYGVCP